MFSQESLIMRGQISMFECKLSNIYNPQPQLGLSCKITLFKVFMSDPLYRACCEGHVEIVKYLLTVGGYPITVSTIATFIICGQFKYQNVVHPLVGSLGICWNGQQVMHDGLSKILFGRYAS